MKRVGVVLAVLVVLLFFGGTVAFLAYKAMEPPVTYGTESAKTADIIKKTVATGALVPRTEIEIKSRVSGILAELKVEAGDPVKAGDLIARIRIVPEPQALERSASTVRTARLNLEEAQRLLEEDEALHEARALPLSDLQRRRSEVARRNEELRAARSDLVLVREGALRNAQAVATDIRSTVSGMVLDVPVKVGETVTETNTFSAGTTIAFVADMSDMIFEGKIDESEVGRISQGMPLTITVGALDNAKLEGTLEHIAPKGILEEGAVQFAIKASISPKDGVFVRAGSSANADIVLDKREGVLAIKESLLKFEGADPYVEIETSPQTFERRDVELGLSDGIMIEVIGGVTADDALKGRAQEG
ncbi:MAG: efflux RND transporter periplasmic adaptor subunit [Myxococcota bacterium]